MSNQTRLQIEALQATLDPAHPEHRPSLYLHAVKQGCPDLSALVNRAMNWKPLCDEVKWPKWCFIPYGLWVKVLYDHFGADKFEMDSTHETFETMVTLGTWRYTQGSYVFDKDFMAALAESDLSGDLPTSVLMRLPEWCVYVSTPNLVSIDNETPVHGFFARLDRQIVGTKITDYLYIRLDTDFTPLTIPIILDGRSISAALENLLSGYDAEKLASEPDAPPEGLLSKDQLIENVTGYMKPLISLLLYLCSDEPEIDNSRVPGISPSCPAPKKIKGTYKVFPAQNITIWNVGQQLGETLRKAGYYTGSSTPGHHKRPHLRRAHWHGYWTGPRTGDRRFSLKWLPPMMVAADNAQETNGDDISASDVPA